MEFKYDAIFGLSYTDTPTYIIDIKYLPEDLDIKEILKEWEYYRESMGLVFENSVEYLHLPIYSNY